MDKHEKFFFFQFSLISKRREKEKYDEKFLGKIKFECFCYYKMGITCLVVVVVIIVSCDERGGCGGYPLRWYCL